MEAKRRTRAPERIGLLIPGIGGAVGSTTASLLAAMRSGGALRQSSVGALLSENLSLLGPKCPVLEPLSSWGLFGWDCREGDLWQAVQRGGVVPPGILDGASGWLRAIRPRPVPFEPSSSVARAVTQVSRDIGEARTEARWSRCVMVNLLPSSAPKMDPALSREEILRSEVADVAPDLIYLLAALRQRVPFVNFTANEIFLPSVVKEANRVHVPLCGLDGATGQTYLKVALATALKLRGLRVHGWYSLNILGNDDGAALRDPQRAANKLAHKTGVLSDVLGYELDGGDQGNRHVVRIDFYAPRGDNKEAWDVVDFAGGLGLPMSIRLNFQARDSILAAPLVLDSARLIDSVGLHGRGGYIKELEFFFKTPGDGSPASDFIERVRSLQHLLHGLCGGAHRPKGGAFHE